MLIVPCNSCASPLPDWELAAGQTSTCPECGVAHQVRLFPAAVGVAPSGQPESAAEGEAACYDHHASRAVATCSHCGRFVCQLCAVESAGNTYCPSCMAMGLPRVTGSDPATSLVAYDSIALSVAVGPVLFFPVMVLTAPIAIFLSLRYWKLPLPLMHANRWRFVAAILIGVLELGGLGWFALYLLLRREAAV